jgi:hypothetical protein
MYWRFPIDKLLSPSSFAEVPRVHSGDLIRIIRSFTNPLWLFRAPATPASAGARGDQDGRHA